jgi:polyisoprenoid-binding protein YceI
MHYPRYKAIAILATSLVALTAGCQAPKPAASPEQVATGGGTPPAVRTRYQVDSAASKLHILVYRAGAMARMGHNHVLSTEQLSGSVVIYPDLARSQLVLDLPVNSLLVDEPQARAAEGEDFSAEVPPEAREGTRANVLRAEVLDAVKFPVITLRAIEVNGSHTAPIVSVSVAIKDVAQVIDVPVQIRYGDRQISATGEFTVKQSAFGITPFSVGMGALQVRDELKIRFAIVARS